MKRHTWYIDPHHDCGEELPVVVELVENWVTDKSCDVGYRLVSWPSSCKCGRPVMHCDPSQADLQAAYELPESEDV